MLLSEFLPGNCRKQITKQIFFSYFVLVGDIRFVVGTVALCGIYSEKLNKKAKMTLKKFTKLSMQCDRQQMSALDSEFSRL